MKKISVVVFLLMLLFSFSACGNETSEEPEKVTEQNQVSDEPEEEPEKKARQIRAGDVITSQDWEVMLTGFYSSTILESEESRTSWTANDGYAFVILEFDIECLNSSKPTIDGSGITNIIATVNGNTYDNWEYQYINSELWLYAKNTYLDANLPLHLYVYTYIPADSIYDKINVDLTIAGERCNITIN